MISARSAVSDGQDFKQHRRTKGASSHKGTLGTMRSEGEEAVEVAYSMLRKYLIVIFNEVNIQDFMDCI